MILIKKTRPDSYLKKFVKYCKDNYQDNLLAIVIYGSYAWGYFDKRKSDYDVFVIFKDKAPNKKALAVGEFKKLFPRVTLQYYCTADELIHKVNEGHWSIYITLIKSGKVLFHNRGYRSFLKKLKKINFVKELLDTMAMQYKARFEINTLKKIHGYKAAKWALPSIRKRLQLLTYIRRKKVIWDLKKVVKLNNDILSEEESNYLFKLDKRVRSRSKKFKLRDKKTAIIILKKLNHELLDKELSKIV